MGAKTITIAGVGEVLLEKSRRARRINLSVRPFRGVRVAVPLGVSFAEAEAVAREKTEWLRKQTRRMGVLEQEAECLPIAPALPRAAARRILVERLAWLARRYGLRFNRVFVRNQKTRWGSCSYRNNINLNIQLARLPERLTDYALLHELVHTRIRNHGPEFWVEMIRLMPDARILDRELDRYSGLLGSR